MKPLARTTPCFFMAISLNFFAHRCSMSRRPAAVLLGMSFAISLIWFLVSPKSLWAALSAPACAPAIAPSPPAAPKPISAPTAAPSFTLSSSESSVIWTDAIFPFSSFTTARSPSTSYQPCFTQLENLFEKCTIKFLNVRESNRNHLYRAIFYQFLFLLMQSGLIDFLVFICSYFLNNRLMVDFLLFWTSVLFQNMIP